MEQERQIGRIHQIPLNYSIRGIELMEQERQIGFLENQVDEMSNRMKNLEYDLSKMTVENNQLRERVTKLATRIPSWPKGYHPQWANKHNHKS